MTPRRERPPLRLLFDELLPHAVARALRELGFRTSYVGNEVDGQPPRSSDDETVLRHAATTNQVVVTSNHDMIILCAEQGQPVVWIDPRGRQFRHDELAALAFAGIATWHRLLDDSDGQVCIHVLRTKVEVLAMDGAKALAEKRMRALARRRRRRAPQRGEVAGQMDVRDET